MARVKCPRCGYEWEYRGRRITVTCPNCRYTFRRASEVRSATVDLSGVWMTVVRKSDYEKMAPAVKRCTELVGGEWKEGEGGMDVYVPDEKAGEWIECLKREGVELVRVESRRH